MEQRSLPETSEELGQELDTNPLLQSDTPLRLFCLVVLCDHREPEADLAWLEAQTRRLASASSFPTENQRRATEMFGYQA